MRKFILSSLELISHIAIFLILLSGVVQGAIVGGSGGSLTGAVVFGLIGFSFALAMCVVLFGVVFLLMEIADNSRRTAAALEAMGSNRAG
jgi:uncharacterized membrane protein